MFIGNELAMKKEINRRPYFKSNGFELYLDDCRDFLNNFPEEWNSRRFA